MNAEIQYFSDDIDFALPNADEISDWLNGIASSENEILSDLTFIFTSDEKLLEINKQYLQHDYYTDVITFPGYGEVLSGEIYISIDRVHENAKDLGFNFDEELSRVMAHGLLHILGYKDKSEAEQLEMRAKEDFYLTLRPKRST